MATPATCDHLVPYDAPVWASQLQSLPKWRVQLAMLPTPIHRWHLPGVPDDVEVYIKRDDLTGNLLTGNKVRKLEFLLADALASGCRHVVTHGGLQSNHCRATAVACRQLGLEPHLLLNTYAQTAQELGCLGNVFLDRMVAANVYVTPPDTPHNVWARVEQLVQRIRTETGEEAYPLPLGGSNHLGLYGYMNAFQELLQQNVAQRFDDIVVASGSGGTTEGLSIANYLSKSSLNVHGIVINRTVEYFYEELQKKLDHLCLSNIKARDIFDAVDGYIGPGYGVSTPEDIDFILDVSAKTGILLDPVYTGKAARGLVAELNNNRQRFKGNRILFVHTGGIFGSYAGRMNDTLMEKSNSLIKFWPTVDSPPW